MKDGNNADIRIAFVTYQHPKHFDARVPMFAPEGFSANMKMLLNFFDTNCTLLQNMCECHLHSYINLKF